MTDYEPSVNIEAEQCCLASMLIEREAIVDCRGELDPREFSRPQYQALCHVIYAMFDRDEAVDLMTVKEELARRGLLDEIGMSHLVYLDESLPTAANVAHYRRIVRRHYAKRQYIEQLRSALTTAEQLDVDEIDQARAVVAASLMDDAPRQSVGLTPFREGLMAAYDDAEQRHEHHGRSGLPTGFPSLDRRLCGLQPGNLVIVGARSGMGKTSFAMALCEAAARTGQTVCFFSLEMTHQEIAQRAACTRGLVDSRDVRAGEMSADDWVRYGEGTQKLYPCPILVDDNSDVSLLDIQAKVRRAASSRPVGLIVIDYLQLLRLNKRTENRTQEVAAIARGLKVLAKQAGVPVIALSQLSRAVDARENKRPVLGDLMESGGIEAAADLVMFLYRETYYAEKQGLRGGEHETAAQRAELARRSQECEVIIGKHRNGADGIVRLGFIPAFTLFHEPAGRTE